MICFTSATFCLILMVLSYQSTQERLTLIQITDEDAPLHTLNFPAVTICNHNKIYKPVADEMEKKLLRLGYDSKTIDNFFRHLPQLIRPTEQNIDYKMFNNMLYLLDSDLRNLMFRLMQPCDKLLKSCIWDGVTYNCSIIFKTVDSLIGHCCGFNYQVAYTYADNNRSPRCKEYYSKYDSAVSFECKNETECPGRKSIVKTPGSGSDVGLTVLLDIEPLMYKGSITEYVGASIIIHEARDFPETNILTTTVQPEHEIDIVVSGTRVEGLDELEALTEAQRKCIFLQESNPDYSYQSCMAGCKIRRILAACDCIPYYYPVTCINISGLCDFKNNDCLKKYQFLITQLHKEVTLDNGKTLEKCNCEEVCNKTYYNMCTDINRRNIPQHLSSWYKNENRNFSKVKVFFQDDGYIKYEMSLFMSWNNLIANLGGLIGLCLGGSFISIMEPIIYFLLTPFRRAHRRQIRQAKEEAKKRAEEESKAQFKDWQKDKNNIFTVQENFNASENRRLNHLNFINKRSSNSKNLELFQNHFM